MQKPALCSHSLQRPLCSLVFSCQMGRRKSPKTVGIKECPSRACNSPKSPSSILLLEPQKAWVDVVTLLCLLTGKLKPRVEASWEEWDVR